MNSIQIYLDNLNKRYQTGLTTEHSYRGDLQFLLEQLLSKEINVTNEPRRIACGAPDYILTKKDIPIGYIEAKNIGKPLNSKNYKKQFTRYKQALENLIITDYLQFEFYREAEKTTSIQLARVENGQIQAIAENFNQFSALIADFVAYQGLTLTNADALAKMMAAKARLMADVIEKILLNDAENDEDSSLQAQMEAFKSVLMHEIEPKEFADIYAQTITYGMFAARLHDKELKTFSRQEAAQKIPHSNPFLRKLFQYIAGYDLDSRLTWAVDELANIFRAADVAQILKNFGKSTAQRDPMIHFYETFLAEYDPKLRKARGVWYTPEPVVDFIVRAVDDVLKTDFGLAEGLADTSKTKIKVDMPVLKGRGKTKRTEIEKIDKEVHKVQLLDPATGTGTFLAAVVKHIYQQGFDGMQGIWTQYVEEDLIPRLNGFEILMASYAMAHLKLDLLLSETGFKPQSQQRLNIYLTNSLEEHHPDTHSLFATWLSQEANEANRIKRDAPVMVVLGNPPYAVSSSNKGDWIQSLIKDYKKNLNERKINLDDDYIKFIRYGQHFIDKNGEGILAYISNNSFIDGLTHRQMRKSLLESFDSIYILDLHGYYKETSPDGSPDNNVFDIKQGVSINIFVKKATKKPSNLAVVHHLSLYGRRKEKYKYLQNNSLFSIDWRKVDYQAPEYFFEPKNFDLKKEYEKYLSLSQIFNYSNSGLQTKKDSLSIHFSQKSLLDTLEDLRQLEIESLKVKYLINNDNGRDWRISWAKEDVCQSNDGVVFNIQYRPFDLRWSYFTGNSKGFLAYPRAELTRNLLRDNLALATMRQIAGVPDKCEIFVTNHAMTDRSMYSSNGTPYLFPLYLYPMSDKQQLFVKKRIKLEQNYKAELKTLQQLETCFKGFEEIFQAIKDKQEAQSLYELQKEHYQKQKTVVDKLKKSLEEYTAPIEQPSIFDEEQARKPNFNPEIIQKIAQVLGFKFTDEKQNDDKTFAPIDLLDYIYAVLHSPTYRETYKEFLKIDFPRVPYPNKNNFWQLVELGGNLRQLHLLESPLLEPKKLITTYPENGDNRVSRKINKNDYQITNQQNNTGRVWINDEQYFDNVPQTAWEFYIGGYQPAQKWLKDRTERTLDRNDIQHYRKIIQTLIETDKLMQQIDKINFV